MVLTRARDESDAYAVAGVCDKLVRDRLAAGPLELVTEVLDNSKEESLLAHWLAAGGFTRIDALLATPWVEVMTSLSLSSSAMTTLAACLEVASLRRTGELSPDHEGLSGPERNMTPGQLESDVDSGEDDLNARFKEWWTAEIAELLPSISVNGTDRQSNQGSAVTTRLAVQEGEFLTALSREALAAALSGRTLPSILVALPSMTSERSIAVLDQRVDGTLQEVGDFLGVTRERARQLEAKARAELGEVLKRVAPHLVRSWSQHLAEGAASEDELFATHLDPRLSDYVQRRLGRIILTGVLEATPLRVFQHNLDGWWTLNPEAVPNAIKHLASYAPFEADECRAYAKTIPVVAKLPLEIITSQSGSPLVFDSRVSGWVRRIAPDRDAAWLLLQRSTRAVSIRDLASNLDLNSRALGAQLQRDPRFAAIKPGDRWALAGWEHIQSSPYKSTLEAVLAVLAEEGAMPLDQLTLRVIERFPVSPSAVSQCLSSELVGRWPDGKIDLVERGAANVGDEFRQAQAALLSVVENLDRLPKAAQNAAYNKARARLRAAIRNVGAAGRDKIKTADDGSWVEFRVKVNHGLLRGSGVPVPPALAFPLGMFTAPAKKAFELAGNGTVHLTRGLSQFYMSALRTVAQDLGCREGDDLLVHLNLLAEMAEISRVADETPAKDLA